MTMVVVDCWKYHECIHEKDYINRQREWGFRFIRSDEGLTLETSAFWIFHGGNSTFIYSFDKTKFLY